MLRMSQDPVIFDWMHCFIQNICRHWRWLFSAIRCARFLMSVYFSLEVPR